jgi:cell fate regulator YaaT (PSP1 superfamily)
VPQLVEVRFKGNRKAFFEWHEPEPLRAREAVVVEAERGLDFGVVNAIGAVARLKCERCGGCAAAAAAGTAPAPEAGEERTESRRRPPEPTRRVARRATATDRRTADELRRSEDDVRRRVRDKVLAHGLAMKVSDAEWQWDKNKLTVYFTAEKRVDFRALVRDLAAQFRTRIELRQIGVRDEAARLSGIGRCGREYCSASWLPELRPIGLAIAKDQRLSLNPSQISGPCGRLLCCLRYEHEFYVQSRKRFPKEGKVLATARGRETVQAIDLFRDRVTLRAEDGSTRAVPLTDLKREVEAAATEPAEQSRPEGRARPEQALEGPAEADTAALVEPSAAPAAEPGPQPGSRPRRRRRRRRR